MSPVYNEGDSICTLYNSLIENKVHFDELYFVYDFDGDTTVPFIKKLAEKDSRVRGHKNDLGRGVVFALKSGFQIAKDGPLIVVMADNSDKLAIIPEMIKLWRDGSKVVSPSRYMPGGKQHGGPKFKKFLSGTQGKFLGFLGFPTNDPTNNFKLYDGEWIRKQEIESTGGFEVALELTGRAYMQGLKISQLPTEWWDRTQGESNFKLWKWLPKYLRWYFMILFAIMFKSPQSTEH
jgi:glycosyltransferase involved in cell wall biosynthesis